MRLLLPRGRDSSPAGGAAARVESDPRAALTHSTRNGGMNTTWLLAT